MFSRSWAWSFFAWTCAQCIHFSSSAWTFERVSKNTGGHSRGRPQRPFLIHRMNMTYIAGYQSCKCLFSCWCEAVPRTWEKKEYQPHKPRQAPIILGHSFCRLNWHVPGSSRHRSPRWIKMSSQLAQYSVLLLGFFGPPERYHTTFKLVLQCPLLPLMWRAGA